jgi:prevent-host-death family protein
MTTVGIRALKQNASAVVAEAAAGDVVIITDRGRPVAMLVPYEKSRMEMLIEAGLATRARRSIRDLPPPAPLRPGETSPSEELRRMREEERY